VAQVFSRLVVSGHAVRRRGREMRAPIFDLPSIAVTDGHVDKVDRYNGDDRPIRTVDIAQGEERIDDRDIGLDEADPVVGERRLRGAVDRLRLQTEVLHHGDPPLQKVTLRRHEGSISVNMDARSSAFFFGRKPV
jgi:hypothetical protein